MCKYQYDAEGRVISATKGSWFHDWVYNALGERVQDVNPNGQYLFTMIYPRDVFGVRMGIFNLNPSIGWVGGWRRH